jgi:DNA polymerase IV (DinB-like DNA polymerase)
MDLDAFFASVEQLDHPEYRGQPVIVGADPKNGLGRGVVSTASYEARKFGLHSAMPISKAYELCPHGIYVFPRGSRYEEISEQVMEILLNITPSFQQVSVDEAYLDITNIIHSFQDAFQLAKTLQYQIQNTIGITASFGIGPTKSLAKIASDYRKPNGITVITPEGIAAFLSPLEITKIPGIGKKTKDFWFAHNIFTIGDLYHRTLEQIKQDFGAQGEWAWQIVHGQEHFKIEDSYGRKSIGAERTFGKDVKEYNILIQKLKKLNAELHIEMKQKSCTYRTVSLKIRFQGFETFTRAVSFLHPIWDEKLSFSKLLELYQEFGNPPQKPVRLIGIRFTNLEFEKKHNALNLSVFLNKGDT